MLRIKQEGREALARHEGIHLVSKDAFLLPRWELTVKIAHQEPSEDIIKQIIERNFNSIEQATPSKYITRWINSQTEEISYRVSV